MANTLAAFGCSNLNKSNNLLQKLVPEECRIRFLNFKNFYTHVKAAPTAFSATYATYYICMAAAQCCM